MGDLVKELYNIEDEINYEALCAELEDEYTIEFSYAESGEEHIELDKDGHMFRLNSRYDPRQLAKIWVDSIEDVSLYSVFIILGLGDGLVLEELMDRYPENTIVVYEPSPKVLKHWLNKKIRLDKYGEKKVFICAGKKGMELYQNYLNHLLSFSNRRLVIWKRLPGYEYAFEKEAEDWFFILASTINHYIVCRNTEIFFEKAMSEAFWKNIDDSIQQYNASELIQKFEEMDFKDRAAIIVSAGPSLDKNVEELRRARNKAFIFAVDSALRTLEKRGIHADLSITVDPEKRIDRFDKIESLKNIPMVMEINSNPSIREKHTGKRFYLTSNNYYYKNVLDYMGKATRGLSTGGSVACSAFDMARQMGFENIVLIGQDLSYPNGQMHAVATYDDQEENNMDNVESDYFEVEGYDGKPVMTESNMDSYRIWFEKQIALEQKRRIINATEGGAKIHGAEIMTLKEVIDEFCEGKEEIDFGRIIDEMPLAYTREEQRQWNSELEEVYTRINSYKDKFQKAIEAFEELDQLKKEGKEDSKEFVSNYKLISETSMWYNKGIIKDRHLLEQYEVCDAHRIGEEALMVKKDETEEWDDIIKVGISEYERLIKAVDDFSDEYNRLRKKK